MFSLVSMKNAEQLNNNHQANKCSVFWFREMPILFPFAFQRSAMSFPCVFSITAAWLNVSHGAFSAPHPMLISCGGLLWDSEREGHHQRDREQRPALTLSVKTRLCWEGHVHVTLTSQLLIYTFLAISMDRNTQKQTGNNWEKCVWKMIQARFELRSPAHNMPVQVRYSPGHVSDNLQDFNLR